MEDNFNNRDFEQFVKRNADQYRMFPSEKVWKNVHHALHTRTRWYGVGLTVLLMTAGIVTWVMLSPSVKNNGALADKPATVSKFSPAAQKNSSSPVLIAVSKPNENSNRFISTTDNLQNNLFVSVPPGSLIDNNNNEEINVSTALQNINQPVVVPPSIQIESPVRSVVVYNKQTIPGKQPVNNSAGTDLVQSSTKLISENKTVDKNAPYINPATEKESIYPLSIESVVNSYKHQYLSKKLSWELFITPTVSYRKLTENKEFLNSAQANNNMYTYTSVAGINSLVTHKPDIGIEVGFNAGYPLTKSLKLIGGLQFNVSKYDIRASFSSAEVATIALNTGGSGNSVSTISNYRNVSYGSKADWLRNLYFSASVPMGAELKLSGNSKNQVGVIGTIQPTYILSDRAYLLSTDYKNYAEVPSLTRRWNMSTSFEIYAGVSTGKINWRIGPQVRYQLRSSYVAKYPFKEHLFDFGLKLGVMLKK